MPDVVDFTGTTVGRTTVDGACDGAKEQGYTDVIIIGVDEAGNLGIHQTFSSDFDNAMKAVGLIELAKIKLSWVFSEEGG